LNNKEVGIKRALSPEKDKYLSILDNENKKQSTVSLLNAYSTEFLENKFEIKRIQSNKF